MSNKKGTELQVDTSTEATTELMTGVIDYLFSDKTTEQKLELADAFNGFINDLKPIITMLKPWFIDIAKQIKIKGDNDNDNQE